MKNSILAFVFCSALLFGQAGAGCAQNRKGSNKTSEPTATNKASESAVRAVKSVGAGWSEYVSDEGRFKVNFPAYPKVEVNKFGTTVISDFKVDQAGAVIWQVSYADDPGFSDDEERLKEAYGGSVRALQRDDRKLISMEDIRLNGKLGVEYVLEGPASVYRTRSFMIGSRLYQVSFRVSGMRASEKAHLTGEVNDFLNSFNFW